MNRFFCILLFLSLATGASYAQTFTVPCKDPQRIEDIFYHCYDQYQPVCGCDGVTYRNACSAEYQYTLFYLNWTDGPCTNFDFDISPNQVVDQLPLRIKKKREGYFSVNIYDVYGHIYFSGVLNYTANPSEPYQLFEIPVLGFEQGVYIIEVITDGEQQLKKFFKVNLD
jgi:hypothetical protein